MIKINRKYKSSLLASIILVLALSLAACGGNDGGMPKSNGKIDAQAASVQSLTAIDEIRETYHDNYAVYYSAESYSKLIEQILGSFTGIGVYIYDDPEADRVTVSSAIKGGPAYDADVRPGDQFLAINDEDMRNQTSDQVTAILKGTPVGTPLDILFNRPGVGELHVTLQVAVVDYPTLEGLMLEGYDGIGMVKIVSFNGTTGQNFAESLNELLAAGMKALVLDLRDNGGGEITSALQVSDVFVDEGDPLMYVVNGKGTISYIASTAALDIPLIVLQNGNSASASEIVLGAIKDYEAGRTLGTQSFGKGIVQDIVRLASGSGLRFTSARYLTAGKHEVHEVGITPDIEFPLPDDVHVYATYTMDPAEDPQLAEAVRLLQEELATAE